MNKAEKKLVKIVMKRYKSPSNTTEDFNRDEFLILERWRAHKIINEDAFLDATSLGDDHKVYLQTLNYPFTAFGDQEIKKNWYLHFRESKTVIVFRDLFTIVAFVASLILSILKIIGK
jgi:hypothetical protein